MKLTETEARIRARMGRLGIDEADLEEQFVRGTGGGGQKINKTSSCVVLKHLPSGKVIHCQRGRSRAANRLYARDELCDRIESEREAARLEKKQERERKRRRNRPRPAGVKRRILKSKRHQGEKKRLRRKPGRDD